MDEDRVVGCILGTAVGDAIGLPYEGLTRQRAARLCGPPDQHRFIFGRGMVSDDTEHTCIVAQSLIVARGDLATFKRSLAWGLRRWLLGLPAGLGMATLRAILKLWLGMSPDKSGVFSAGNGPAMRAAVLGVALDDTTTLRELIRASSRITHTEPKAELGAFAVALAAHMAARSVTVSAEDYVASLALHLGDESPELMALIADVIASVGASQRTEDYAQARGFTTGVSGYMYHTVPIALHAWLTHQRDYRAAIIEVVRCDGDTDSVAAIVGGLIGASVGRAGIPEDWRAGLADWPMTVTWMEVLGRQLASSHEPSAPAHPPRLPVLGLLARNLFFFVVVMCHGFRRLAPPY